MKPKENKMKKGIDLICAGHITKNQRRECTNCAVDELNKKCPKYEPMAIYYYDAPKLIFKNDLSKN